MKAALLAVTAIAVASMAIDAHAQDAPRWPGTVLTEVSLRVALPAETGFDRALRAHRYGVVRAAPGVALGVATPVAIEWLWIGARLGVRGRTWDNPSGDDATLVAPDLCAMLHARWQLGSVLELGVNAGGGVGLIALSVGDVRIDQAAPRFTAEGVASLAADPHFAVGVRVGYDYFAWSGINRYAHDVDAGGLTFALALEVRE